MTKKKTRKLTLKQKLFVEKYIQTKNGVLSAELAGYKGNYNTLKQVASENLSKPYIADAIATRFADVAMDSDEVLGRLASMARGFEISDYVEQKETYAVNSKGKEYFAGYTLFLDLDRLKKDGYSHLIKKIHQSKFGITIEWHNQMDALVHIGKNLKLFTDKFEIDDISDPKPSAQLIIQVLQEVDKGMKRKK